MGETQCTQFFKVLEPGFENRLPLPKAFWRYLNDNLGEAIIESCQGSWPVKIGRIKDGVLAFEEGWKHFVKHHRLEEEDFLIFEHKGNMVFHVSIYDINGNEKKFLPPTNGMITPSEAHSESSEENPQTSFNIMMSKTHSLPNRGYVTIPKAFVISNGLRGNSNMILRRSRKEWPVKLGIWKTQTVCTRTAIKSEGWCKFYADNKLKDGDVCKFELHEVPRSGAEPVIMDVSVTQILDNC